MQVSEDAQSSLVGFTVYQVVTRLELELPVGSKREATANVGCRSKPSRIQARTRIGEVVVQAQTPGNIEVYILIERIGDLLEFLLVKILGFRLGTVSPFRR